MYAVFDTHLVSFAVQGSIGQPDSKNSNSPTWTPAQQRDAECVRFAGPGSRLFVVIRECSVQLGLDFFQDRNNCCSGRVKCLLEFFLACRYCQCQMALGVVDSDKRFAQITKAVVQVKDVVFVFVAETH